MSLTRNLYRAARLAADVRSLCSPSTVANRAKNKVVGRALGRPEMSPDALRGSV